MYSDVGHKYVSYYNENINKCAKAFPRMGGFCYIIWTIKLLERLNPMSKKKKRQAERKKQKPTRKKVNNKTINRH